MQKEEWIESILESSADIKPAEPNPYLFNKIQLAIERPVEKLPAIKWALVAGLIVIMNVACISFVSFSKKQQNNEEALNSLSQEMGFNSNYNY